MSPAVVVKASWRDFARDSFDALVDAVEAALDGTDAAEEAAGAGVVPLDFFPRFLLSLSLRAFHASCSVGL